MTLSTVPYALVVDDDPLIMMDTTGILEDAGFRFYEAMDGDEAKRILAANWEKIVLLFSDVDMPGETNGFALARHVAQNWPAIEIVIASGHVLPKAGEMPEKATFISKPFNKQMVHGHLRKMLPNNKSPESLKKAV
ncbi:response regulator [Sphingomonas sp. ZB1N12]|uniref:response regulator n=1 Tax=Sphingomonas arabinosi TaxID=3096160 RepID=UPI002FCA9992